jgi:flagellar basal-body rod modification protein FlgD
MDKPIGILPPGLEHLSIDREAETKADKGLGQDAFLELMITQLKNQDPLKPMESGDFLGQIAQFGTVNGITELQKSFNTLALSLQSNQALQASTMVGREVLIDGKTVQVRDSGAAGIAVELAGDVSDLKLTIADQSGQLVREIRLGAHRAGLSEFEWDGLNANGARVVPGRYTVEAEAIVDGGAVAVPTLIRAPVESVTLSRDGQLPVLNLTDIGAVDFSAIRRVM